MVSLTMLTMSLLIHLESCEEKAARLSLLKQVKEEYGQEMKVSVKNNSNQFSFIERANQSTIFDSDDTASQTDPPPM